MRRVFTIPVRESFQAWRSAARTGLAEGIPPDLIFWTTADDNVPLFAETELPQLMEPASAVVPQTFLDLGEQAICHRDPGRFALLYTVLWRLREERSLLGDESDADVAALMAMRKAVSRDCHKMKAFVRFREGEPAPGGRRRFAAWFEPDHFIVERTAPFFARRFADMDWLIATPDLVARCDMNVVSFERTGMRPPQATDQTEGLWRTYFASIFNPARLKIKAMQAEMPKKYWRNLPEAVLIPDLIAHAGSRAETMERAAPPIPPRRTDKAKMTKPAQLPLPESEIPRSLRVASAQARSCTRCPLYLNATQTVFGEGPDNAPVMFVGEQPGDKEDLAGRPFVGPAGQLFDRLLTEAGVAREKCLVTNAVKHFKHEPRGKFRLHKRPDAGEVQACRWWLKQEKDLIQPRLIVVLGATAAYAVTGSGDQVLKRRGSFEKTADGTPVLMSIHPSSLLRQPNRDEAEISMRKFRDELRKILDVVPEVAV